MVIIGAVVGGGAIVGLAYDDHSDHSDYGNYDNYSDAEERRRRRKNAKQAEVDSCVQDINQYKNYNINPYLSDQTLIAQSGVEVSVEKVRQDGSAKIDHEEEETVSRDTKDIKKEIEEIDSVLAAIDRVLEANDEND
jgi:hypothetical protein